LIEALANNRLVEWPDRLPMSSPPATGGSWTGPRPFARFTLVGTGRGRPLFRSSDWRTRPQPSQGSRDAWRGAAERRPLAGDASFRRYGGSRATATARFDGRAAARDVRPFIESPGCCCAGLHAPAIYAADEAAGLLLLEVSATAPIRGCSRAGTTARIQLAVDV
jgi:hypothetical protein